MSDLSDFKRMVYEPEIRSLRRLYQGERALRLAAERGVAGLKNTLEIIDQEHSQCIVIGCPTCAILAHGAAKRFEWTWTAMNYPAHFKDAMGWLERSRESKSPSNAQVYATALLDYIHGLEEQIEGLRSELALSSQEIDHRDNEILGLQEQLERCRERMENILLDPMGTSGPKLYELREFLDREFPISGSNPARES